MSPRNTTICRLRPGTGSGTADIDHVAIGLKDIVFIEVTLDKHDDKVITWFGDALARIPEVIEANLVTGDYDYLVKVAADRAPCDRGILGIMVNYLYDHDSIEDNHEAFVRGGTIIRSPDVDALLANAQRELAPEQQKGGA